MRKLTTGIVLISSVLLTACYSQGGWTPTVDPYNDQNAYRINQDIAECRQLASQASGGTAKETAIGAGVGALVGAAGGAVVGAFTGNPGAGAAIGAAAGGFGGGAKQGFSSEEQFKRSYSSCMRNRGHNTMN